MLLSGLAMVSLVFGARYLDGGEVATLVTFDRMGRPMTTELWVVDVDGSTYVRAAGAGDSWLARAEAHPRVHLGRGGGLRTVMAVPVDDDSVRGAVDRAMARKYGLIERMVLVLRDPSQSVPVRLDPLTTAAR
jgi:hypothetical protein